METVIVMVLFVKILLIHAKQAIQRVPVFVMELVKTLHHVNHQIQQILIFVAIVLLVVSAIANGDVARRQGHLAELLNVAQAHMTVQILDMNVKHLISVSQDSAVIIQQLVKTAVRGVKQLKVANKGIAVERPKSQQLVAM